MATPKMAKEASSAVVSLPAGKKSARHQHRRRGIDVEIIEFDRRADEARQNHARARIGEGGIAIRAAADEDMGGLLPTAAPPVCSGRPTDATGCGGKAPQRREWREP